MNTGVRARKRADTRRRLSDVALSLAAARGLHGFTVADVTAEAGISPRTFFNHFRTKEEALFAWDEDALDEMVDALLARPADEHPVHAIAAAVTPTPERLTEVVGRWEVQRRLIGDDPGLLAHHLAGIAVVEERLAGAMATRLGSAPGDPFPVVVVAATMGAFRAALEWREGLDEPGDVLELLAVVLDDLQTGFRR